MKPCERARVGSRRLLGRVKDEGLKGGSREIKIVDGPGFHQVLRRHRTRSDAISTLRKRVRYVLDVVRAQEGMSGNSQSCEGRKDRTT